MNRAGIVPYQPLQPTGAPVRDVVHAVLKIAWWLWAAWFVVGFLRVLFRVESRPHEGRLLHDLLAGVIYLTALLAIVRYVFDQPIEGMLATSGVIAIILGLALQSTLGDVFSGIVLSFSRPYRPGDWVNIEGATEGQVIEMNWRATLILTGRRDLAIVPNSSIAKAKIVNVSSPSGVHGVSVTIETESDTPPARCIELLQRAALNCRAILHTAEPVISVKSIKRTGTAYEVTFFIEELAAATGAQNEMLDLIYRHLASAGIDIAMASDENRRPADPHASASRTRSERVLDLVDILQPLTAHERSAIAAKLRSRLHDPGDSLVQPGTVVRSLFIVAEGVLAVAREDGDAGSEILRLGPGDYFGVIGVLAGAPSAVRISALTPATVYELTNEELGPVLEASPEASRKLSRSLARWQAAGKISSDAAPAAEATSTNQIGTWFDRHFHRHGLAAP
ncbi:MAG: mechanosensitive ion channel family protein [Methylobacteriaceae bacterium]|nr:mechanosensitive ion channel family protein [Methylobacteriaceae bacterium]